MNPTAPAGGCIALFGGSFDPVHLGHLALARSALAALPIDQLRWVPAGQPWQKRRRLADASDRVAMLELALADPRFGDRRFAIERCELERSGPSYTIDTVLELQRREPGRDWLLLIGQDQHAGLHSWHRWRELLGLVRLAVAVRPDAVAGAVDPEVLAAGHIELPMAPVELSSTGLRECVAAGRRIDDLVPPAVAGYIDRHRLYRDGGAPNN